MCSYPNLAHESKPRTERTLAQEARRLVGLLEESMGLQARSSSSLLRLRVTHVFRQLYPGFVLREGRYAPLSLLAMSYVLSIVATGVYLVCMALLPYLKEKPLVNSFILAVFAWCIVMCVASYLLTACVDPGRIPDSWRPQEDATADGDQCVVATPPHPPAVDVATMLASDGQPRFCTKCRIFKPDRAHHCSSCKRCVLCMGSFLVARLCVP